MVAISAPIAATAMPAPATARRAGSNRATEYAAINAGISPEKNDAIAPVKICDSENVPTISVSVASGAIRRAASGSVVSRTTSVLSPRGPPS